MESRWSSLALAAVFMALGWFYVKHELASDDYIAELVEVVRVESGSERRSTWIEFETGDGRSLNINCAVYCDRYSTESLVALLQRQDSVTAFVGSTGRVLGLSSPSIEIVPGVDWPTRVFMILFALAFMGISVALLVRGLWHGRGLADPEG